MERWANVEGGVPAGDRACAPGPRGAEGQCGGEPNEINGEKIVFCSTAEKKIVCF